MKKDDSSESLSSLQRPGKLIIRNPSVTGTHLSEIDVLKLFHELQVQLLELGAENAELSKQVAENDKFFSIIAHDLRSPFNAFLGLTQLMAEELHSLSPDEIQEIAVSLRNSATNLYRLLENLLEWSRIQRGLTHIIPESHNLLRKIDESVQSIIESANNKKISIEYDIPKELSVYTDGNMLAGIIRNLVSNAVKFTPKGGDIKISAKSVPDNQVEISIQDSGIGMDKDIIDNLFRHDVNTNRKGTEGESSTGLGLIICRDFIERQGGKLKVESEKGSGSRFYFCLPQEKT
jgi:signal transduction histidine kinase